LADRHRNQGTSITYDYTETFLMLTHHTNIISHESAYLRSSQRQYYKPVVWLSSVGCDSLDNEGCNCPAGGVADRSYLPLLVGGTRVFLLPSLRYISYNVSPCYEHLRPIVQQHN